MNRDDPGLKCSRIDCVANQYWLTIDICQTLKFGFSNCISNPFFPQNLTILQAQQQQFAIFKSGKDNIRHDQRTAAASQC